MLVTPLRKRQGWRDDDNVYWWSLYKIEVVTRKKFSCSFEPRNLKRNSYWYVKIVLFTRVERAEPPLAHQCIDRRDQHHIITGHCQADGRVIFCIPVEINSLCIIFTIDWLSLWLWSFFAPIPSGNSSSAWFPLCCGALVLGCCWTIPNTAPNCHTIEFVVNFKEMRHLSSW